MHLRPRLYVTRTKEVRLRINFQPKVLYGQDVLSRQLGGGTQYFYHDIK
jgi:hypothetical protein